MATAGALGRLNVVLGLNYTEFTQGLSKSEYQAKVSMDRISSSVKKVTLAYGALGTLAGGALAASIRRSTDEMLKLTNRAAQVQMPVEQFTGYAAAAQRADVSVDSFTRTMRRLGQAVASDSKQFLRLGIDVRELHDTEDALRAVAEAMSKMPEGAEKVDIARSLMGRAGTEMIAFMDQGAAGIDKLVAKQKELGNVISNDTAARLAEYDNAMKDIQDTMHGLRQQIAVAALPAITALARGFAEDLAPAADASKIATIDWGAASGAAITTTADVARSGLFTIARGFEVVGKTAAAAAAQLSMFLGGDLQGVKFVGDAWLEDMRDVADQFARFDSSKYRDLFVEGAGSSRSGFAVPGQTIGGGGAAGKGRGRGAVDRDPLGDFLQFDLWRQQQQKQQTIMDTMADVTERLTGRQREYQRQLDVMGQGSWAASLATELNSIEDKYRELLEGRRNSMQGLTDMDRAAFMDMMATEQQMAIDHYAQLKSAQADWLRGARQGLINYADEVKNVYGQMDSTIRNLFSGMEDALTDFVMGGKSSFRDLADSIIRDMIRITIQQQITGPLAGWLGNAIGGMFAAGGYTGDGGRYQPAGIVHKGEGVLSQPEIKALGGPAGFAALRAAIRGPGHAIGGMAGSPSLPGRMNGGGVTVHVNVTERGRNSQAPAGWDSFAKDIGRYVESKYREMEARSMRQGGTLWAARQGSF